MNGTSPKADRLSQYLAVNRELLAELVDIDSISTMLRPEAIEAVESQLQHTAEGSKARSPEELMELLLRIGDLSEEEVVARCAGNGLAMLRQLENDGRALRAVIAGVTRWIAGEEQQLYQDLNRPDHARLVVRRYVQNHGPVTSVEFARRYGFDPEVAHALANGIASESNIIQGRFRPRRTEGDDDQQWCYRPNVERIHRQTISILRKEITLSTPAQFTRFLLSWQHLHPQTEESGAGWVAPTLAQLQGLPLPADIWERGHCAETGQQVHHPSAQSATSTGAFVWCGAGSGKMKVIERGNGNLLIPAEPGDIR